MNMLSFSKAEFSKIVEKMAIANESDCASNFSNKKKEMDHLNKYNCAVINKKRTFQSVY